VEELLTAAECAAHHGITARAVQTAINSGRLAATRFGRAWMIRKADCLAFRPVMSPEERGKRGGRPRKEPQEPQEPQEPKRPRGRPRKSPPAE
jgi:hypothetical protein